MDENCERLPGYSPCTSQNVCANTKTLHGRGGRKLPRVWQILSRAPYVLSVLYIVVYCGFYSLLCAFALDEHDQTVPALNTAQSFTSDAAVLGDADVIARSNINLEELGSESKFEEGDKFSGVGTGNEDGFLHYSPNSVERASRSVEDREVGEVDEKSDVNADDLLFMVKKDEGSKGITSDNPAKEAEAQLYLPSGSWVNDYSDEIGNLAEKLQGYRGKAQGILGGVSIQKAETEDSSIITHNDEVSPAVNSKVDVSESAGTKNLTGLFNKLKAETGFSTMKSEEQSPCESHNKPQEVVNPFGLNVKKEVEDGDKNAGRVNLGDDKLAGLWDSLREVKNGASKDARDGKARGFSGASRITSLYENLITGKLGSNRIEENKNNSSLEELPNKNGLDGVSDDRTELLMKTDRRPTSMNAVGDLINQSKGTQSTVFTFSSGSERFKRPKTADRFSTYSQVPGIGASTKSRKTNVQPVTSELFSTVKPKHSEIHDFQMERIKDLGLHDIAEEPMQILPSTSAGQKGKSFENDLSSKPRLKQAAVHPLLARYRRKYRAGVDRN